MRILFTIAHFFNPNPEGIHGSQNQDPQLRIQALTACIASLHHLFGKSQCIIDIGQRVALPANHFQAHDIDIIVCTSKDYHLLDRLPLSSHLYKHYRTQAEPMLLGFECQSLMRDCLGSYEYFCYLEDDLILHDPWFFVKLGWFSKQCGYLNLLQPNRYEVGLNLPVGKAYVDGDLLPRVTENFQNVEDDPELSGQIMNAPVVFRRTLNPHSGCYFLNVEQMNHWAQQPYFLDRDTSFVGPLESAATLGIMRTFRIYKPGPAYAGFLEIQHFGAAFLSLIGNEVRLQK